MNEWKEVWYVWDGVSVPLEVKKCIDDEGNIYCEELCFEIMLDYTLTQGATAGYVSAYTLGQKRRRVECGNCCEGWFCYDDIHEAKCHACNGTGFIKGEWEYQE